MEIKLQLTSKINEAFLRMVMNAKEKGPISISRSIPLGKYICSRVRYSNLPVKQSSGKVLHLPKTTLESGQNHFIYFTVEDQKKINDNIESDFYNFFDRIMIEGERLGQKKNKLIELVISKLNLQNDSKIFENLKKYDYRERQKVKKLILKQAQRAG